MGQKYARDAGIIQSPSMLEDRKNYMANLKSGSKLGKHLLVDFFGVGMEKLQDRRSLMKVLRSALKEAGFRIITEAGSHKFHEGGKGVTGFILLAESHAAFHSYPEYGYIALDIYACGKHDPRSVAEKMEKYLGPQKVSRVFHRRGVRLSRSSLLIH